MPARKIISSPAKGVPSRNNPVMTSTFPSSKRPAMNKSLVLNFKTRSPSESPFTSLMESFTGATPRGDPFTPCR